MKDLVHKIPSVSPIYRIVLFCTFSIIFPLTVGRVLGYVALSYAAFSFFPIAGITFIIFFMAGTTIKPTHFEHLGMTVIVVSTITALIGTIVDGSKLQSISFGVIAIAFQRKCCSVIVLCRQNFLILPPLVRAKHIKHVVFIR